MATVSKWILATNRGLPSHVPTRCRSGKVKLTWGLDTIQHKPRFLALQYFDSHYRAFYGPEWHRMRVSLLSQQKYAAVTNRYARSEEDMLNMKGAFDFIKVSRNWEHVAHAEAARENRQDITSAHSSSGDVSVDAKPDEIGDAMDDEYMPVQTTMLKGAHGTVVEVSKEMEEFRLFPSIRPEPDEELSIPSSIQAFMYPASDISLFTAPRVNQSGFLGYYLMDAASILPVCALGLNSGTDRILDLCAAPGGKSYVILQSLMYENLTCNDISHSRLVRLADTLRFYFPPEIIDKHVKVTRENGVTYHKTRNELYDKVLVDVPCTTDRQMLFVDENNIFHNRRLHERSELPNYQAQLLKSAILMCRPGGTVVYSTCTLSPLQNDVVIQTVLQDLLDQPDGAQVVVKDLTQLVMRFKKFFRFDRFNCKYGKLVVPNLTANFGPMYICKLRRTK